MTSPPRKPLLDVLYGAQQVAAWAQSTYPQEPPRLLVSAMLVPKNDRDDTIQRVTARSRRGVFLATDERFVFRTALWMPMNVGFMLVALGCFGLWLGGGGLPAMMLAAFGVAGVIQRRPYHLEIPSEQVKSVILHNTAGVSGAYHTLILHTANASYQVVMTAALPEAARDFLLEV